MNDKVSLEEAISISRASIQLPEITNVPISAANMRVSSEDIVSSNNVPDFDRSAMDGYTISRIDMEQLEKGSAVSLKVAAIIRAGSTDIKQVRPGEIYKIFTGALLPEGCAAVIKQEDVQTNGDFIQISKIPRNGENTLKAGNEFRAGDLIAGKGQVITSEVWERIAAGGVNSISVYEIPRVYVIDTGSELVLPGSAIKKGQIYGSNRSLISGKLLKAGAIPLVADRIVEDNVQAIMREIEKAILLADMVIITGGTGNGDYDLVHQATKELNALILFKGIDINPGKGSAAALYRGKILFNLSGNPNAAGIMFDTLIKPVLCKLKGELSDGEKWFELPLGSSLKTCKLVRSLLRGEMIIHQGSAYAQPLSKKKTITEHIPLILDLDPGLGNAGDMVRAKIN